jgi:ABC-2 type transport system ATP-binding protein
MSEPSPLQQRGHPRPRGSSLSDAAVMSLASSGSEGLRITDLAKRYGSVVAVDGLDLAVPRGALIGFLGPNGSGKTTTMRAILGMVSPDRGVITWDGSAIDDTARTRIGYMPQERGLYLRMRVREQVRYFGRLAGLSSSEAAARTDYWLERLGLDERADALVQELSGGNQQRVQLAVSLVHDPDLLVLDEPFAGLDPVAAETMRSIIAERSAAGASVLFSSHQLDVVEDLCEEVVIVAAGRLIASGRIDDLRAASTTRWLRVHWADPVESWQPTHGTIEFFDGSRSVVRMTSDVDVTATIAQALAAGPVSQVALEPPALDEVFTELVAHQRAGAPERRTDEVDR